MISVKNRIGKLMVLKLIAYECSRAENVVKDDILYQCTDYTV